MVYSWVKYEGYVDKRDKFPVWADALGWMMTLFVIATIVIVTLVKIITAPDEGRGVCIFDICHHCDQYIENIHTFPANIKFIWISFRNSSK